MRGKREARNDEPTPKVRATVSPNAADVSGLDEPARSKSSRSFRLSMESSQRLRLSQSQSHSLTLRHTCVAYGCKHTTRQTANGGAWASNTNGSPPYKLHLLSARPPAPHITVHGHRTTTVLPQQITQTIVCPPLSASFRAFKPLKPGSSLFLSAPASSSALATCSWPLWAASIKGVHPALV